jgi:hypothetical protein
MVCWGVKIRFLRAYVNAAMVLKEKKLELQLLPDYVLSEDIGPVDQLQPHNPCSGAQKGESTPSPQAEGGGQSLLHCCSTSGRGIDQVVANLQVRLCCVVHL